MGLGQCREGPSTQGFLWSVEAAENPHCFTGPIGLPCQNAQKEGPAPVLSEADSGGVVDENQAQVFVPVCPWGEYILPQTQLELGHSMVWPYPYADPCSRGILTSYGHQVATCPPMEAIQQTYYLPLPPQVVEEQPVYVNAKQYDAILRRRLCRAKLEYENKIAKDRKPYLHKSRHLHALRRERDSGGRFLNKKGKKEEMKGTSNCEQSRCEQFTDQVGNSTWQFANPGQIIADPRQAGKSDDGIPKKVSKGSLQGFDGTYPVASKHAMMQASYFQLFPS